MSINDSSFVTKHHYCTVLREYQVLWEGMHIHYILLDKMQGHIHATLALHVKGESFLAVPF